MYSSCKEAHIAVNEKIQQINANRQESIRPQYIDIALNEAIDVLLTQKIKAFEETGRYYDDLQVLKSTYTSPLYLNPHEDMRGYAYLPANYLHGVAYNAKVIYDKFNRYRAVKSITTQVTVINLSKLFALIPAKLPVVSITINDDRILLDYPLKIYRKEGKFEFINYALSTIRQKGYNVSYELFDGKYYGESLVFRFDRATNVTVESPLQVSNESFKNECYSGEYEVIQANGVVTETKQGKYVGMDLVSDVQRMDMIQTYHNRANRHLHPICVMGDDKLLVDMDKTFIITDVNIVYLRQPTWFNIVTDTISELPFKTEIVDLATQKLLGILKDPGYQVAINENNALK